MVECTGEVTERLIRNISFRTKMVAIIKKDRMHRLHSGLLDHYALLFEPNSRILPTTVALIASRPGPMNLRGS